ncbi:MAG: tRNA-dihydrouridine synthase 3 [Chrysothrix sp. TS-e1954]|nr:MAG: tRNA-dihydrouridine synthase 3 [Chrysothrix sp. TS-e1954]
MEAPGNVATGQGDPVKEQADSSPINPATLQGSDEDPSAKDGEPTLHDGPSLDTTVSPEAAAKAADTGAEPNKSTESSHQSSEARKRKLDEFDETNGSSLPPRKKGVASIKPEFLIQKPAEPAGAEHVPSEKATDRRQKSKGQNTNRSFGSSRDALPLCMSRQRAPEFSPKQCQFGDVCKYEHDLRKYLKDGKRDDLSTFGGGCPVHEALGRCSAGWRCRFVGSHSEERRLDDGRHELVLLDKATDEQKATNNTQPDDGEVDVGTLNIVTASAKIELKKKKFKTEKADKYTDWLNKITDHTHGPTAVGHRESEEIKEDNDAKADNRARYIEPPFMPSEKRRLYYGPETPVLAPLTTQGNLPFRRLCVELGAQVTWSEMAMSLPLIQGEKSEWALLKAHESEVTPPGRAKAMVVDEYDNSKDLKFGAQIAGSKPWVTLKATQVLTTLCPNLRAIDLNCGCPIDLVYRQGAGSALLDSHARLEKILRGMNAVSGEVPITTKIRMGVKDDKPTALKLVERLAFGSDYSADLGLGPAGVAAVTLHGRSRQQRYTKNADWGYISECAALIKELNEKKAARVDTGMDVDPRHLPSNDGGRMYFLGNGDCFSHVDYYEHIEQAKVDSVMVGRGALIKPWIFEEIETGQYLDKSSSERLRYIEKFVRYGLQTWGSDEIGVGTTRRFLLEWLSFACRYVPLGLLEHMPPKINDRAPIFRGRDDLETLLSSDNFKDWIKISEMFLGPAHPNFRFEPKHKSNAHTEIEG